jgi:hypothetical protein
MLALFLLLVLVAIVLGIVGVVVHGLLYLLIIGIVVFLAGGPAGPRHGEPQAARVTTGRDSTARKQQFRTPPAQADAAPGASRDDGPPPYRRPREPAR